MKKLYVKDKRVVKIKVNVLATVRDAKTGRVKHVKNYHNIVPTVARTAIAQHLSNPSPTPASLLVNYGAVGTDSTTAANSDTTLGTEVARNTVVSHTNADNIAYITAFFAATDAVATLREAALFINGTATADSGTLFSRVIINVTKSNTETLTLDWTITIS
ncbi:MAG TPA: hypothetical protein VFX17_02100 [Patescibacteria group bacterium]|nr:hypothetical protein [Patescibacteria group bacterium]